MPESAAARAARRIRRTDLHARRGKVCDLIGLVVEVSGLDAEVGELCEVRTGRGRPDVPAEVVGFRGQRTLLMPLGELTGIGPGDPVTSTGRQLDGPVGPALLGRVIDGLGRPLDGGAPVDGLPRRPLAAAPPGPLERPRITEQVPLGVRALDALVPCGRGQRLGIFAGSGVGKSSLLGMIARAAEDAGPSGHVNVVCLVGERGREVLEFVQRDLGEALARSVVIVATSDQPALVRLKAALLATTIAEAFRDAGQDVMLMMDSVTRFAMAQREVGLAVGEPPSTRGYTPSVYAVLPKLLERSGTAPSGAITALYTVLVDGDDMNEPIADAVRSILDGHVVLSRELAHAGHYPAIDVLQSVSRLEGEITAPADREAARDVRSLLAAHKANEDLIAIGAYVPGSDPLVDRAVALRDGTQSFLRQAPGDRSTPEGARSELGDVLAAGGGMPAAAEADVLASPGAVVSPAPAIPPLHLAV